MDVWSSLTTNIHLGHSNQWDQSALCFFAQATRDCHKGACSSVPRPSLSLKTVSGGLISPIPFLSAHTAACCCSVCAGKHGGKIKISPEADMQSLVLAHGKLVSGSDPSRSITGQSQCWRNYLSIYRAAAWVFCASGLSHLPSASPVTGNEHAEHCWQRKSTTLQQNRPDTFYWQYWCHTQEPQPSVRLLVLTCMTSISDQLYLKYS